MFVLCHPILIHQLLILQISRFQQELGENKIVVAFPLYSSCCLSACNTYSLRLLFQGSSKVPPSVILGPEVPAAK